MKALPLPARLFVCAVIAAGACLMALSLPTSIPHPMLLVAILALSSVTSVFKVTLPMPRNASTMSVSYAVDFAGLLLLGTQQTMVIAAISAWSQCTFRIKEPNPPHRTLFSMASLVITVYAAGFAYARLGGRADGLVSWTGLSALAGAATTYFLVNTALVATAIALSTRTQVLRVWNENFLWSAPSYFVGAAVAGAVMALLRMSSQWLIPLGIVPLYLTYRSYKVYLGRIEEEQRHVREAADLHLATIEALALAIDAKDQTSQLHIRRVQLYAAALARAEHAGAGDPGGQDRGAPARHRQARGPRTHPVQAGTAHAGGVPEDPRAPEDRGRHHQRGAVPVSGRAADPQPPRAVGRQGLPDRPQGGGDPARRPHPLGRGLLRRADGGAAVSQGHAVRRRGRAAAAGTRQGTRPDGRRDVRRAAADADA